MTQEILTVDEYETSMSASKVSWVKLTPNDTHNIDSTEGLDSSNCAEPRNDGILNVERGLRGVSETD